MRVVVIDLGTNTFHLLIAEVFKSKQWKKIHHSRITVKLGQKGIHKDIIAPQPYKRGLRALEKFGESINKYKVSHVYAFGTAALRISKNGKQFLKDVFESTGIKVDVISGDREAELIYLGVRQAINLAGSRSLIMDIGGGSVEFIIADENKVYWKHSFKLGAAYLIERFNPDDPLSNSDLRQIRRFIRTELNMLQKVCIKYKPVQIVGSAGSFETFASMIRHQFPGSGSHYGKFSHRISYMHFRFIYRQLILSDHSTRYQMKGLIKMRADMIVMAALLLDVVLSLTRLKEIKLSAYALKEGALWRVLKKTAKI